eukprot:GCRY01001571.1.p1 GENE.GCRY01001571.1~~GCRY01001571.1.p1  ORF type:complete len:425 (+),score=65.08 GCRY01001571.1:100-1275(+)
MTSESEKTIEENISICTWNVMAQGCANASNLPDIPRDVLSKQNRFRKIFEHLEQLNADIFCLQECCKVLEYQKKLHTIGYRSFYRMRNKKNDGSIIFYKNEKFEALENHCFYFEDHFEQMSLREDEKAVFRKGGNVLIALKLKPRNSNSPPFLVVCCYLYYDPGYELEVKGRQLEETLKWANAINPDNIPVIFCGDFNVMKGGTVYNRLMNGEYICNPNEKEHSMLNLDYWSNYIDPTKPPQIGDGLSPRPPLPRRPFYQNLRSMYRSPILEKIHNGSPVQKEEDPQFTNVSKDFIACLDYIFYNPTGVSEPSGDCWTVLVKSVKKLPKLKKLVKDHGSLPTKEWPSDHLPLLANFCILSAHSPEDLKKKEDELIRKMKMGKEEKKHSYGL